jgi:L-ribulose-5-phosphate 3-epimerase
VKSCISYWSVEGGLEGTAPVTRAINDAVQAGFPGIELCIADQGALSITTSERECRDIRKAITSAGLLCETAAIGMAWGSNPIANDPAVRQRSHEQHVAAIRRAGWLGCRSVLVVPGVVGSPICPAERVRYADAEVRARAFIEGLIPHAAQAGVEICLENVWNGFLYSPTAMRDFIDSFSTPLVGAYFDVGNVLGWHQDPVDWIETLGRRVYRVHVKDFKLTFGFNGSFSFCDLGTGDVVWPEVMRALAGIGYQRTVVAEMMPWRSDLLPVTAAAMTRMLALANPSTAAAMAAQKV